MRGAYAIVHGDGFEDTSEELKIEALFGEKGPGGQIGRYCSLNVAALSKFGTLEVRNSY